MSPEVLVFIPTRGRVARLRQALHSVASQSRRPKGVYVIGERQDDLPSADERSALANDFAPTRIKWLTNERDYGPGGALNTALVRVLAEGTAPPTTFIALLDDDDTWEATYLARLTDLLVRETYSVVVTGLVRHELPTGPGIRLSVPEEVGMRDFLVGNPHVQNSNLVVRLDTLLLAGGWDEALPSTLDRDLMVRILDLNGVHVGFVREHLVHHWALRHDRLSTPGSSSKTEGLRLFLLKHRSRMDQKVLEEFGKRARTLFRTEDLESTPLPEASTFAPPGTGSEVDLVLGFTVSRREAGTQLCMDIAEYLGPTGRVKGVVICDNLQEPDRIEAVVAPLSAAGIRAGVVSRESIDRDASSGRLTDYYVAVERRRGVAYGRTELHRRLHKEAARHPGCVVWILDDDLRLNPVRWGPGRTPLTAAQFLATLAGLKRQGVRVAVGGIAGDPPLPAAMTVRGQLLDLCEGVRAIRQARRAGGFFLREGAPPSLLERFPEYHHDLSLRHHGHLEIPFGIPTAMLPVTSSQPDEVYSRIIRGIANGQSISRPSRPIPSTDESSLPTRGGNTFVFDADLLRAVPNLAPWLGDIPCRRGDTLWTSILKRLGGALVGEGLGRVVSVALSVQQDRGTDIMGGPSWESFKADVLGRALTRSIDPVLAKRRQDPEERDLTALLMLGESEIEEIVASMRQLVEAQIGDLLLMSWRVRGLSDVLDRLLGAEDAPAARTEVAKIASFFSETHVATVVHDLRGTPFDELRQFLRDLPRFQRQFASSLVPILPDGWLGRQQTLLESSLGYHDLSLLGSGYEGAVFSDGKVAVKCFFDGTASLSESDLQLIQSALVPGAGPRHLVPVRRVWRLGTRLAILTDFIPGQRYSGGCYSELLALLREVRQLRLVVRNVSPDNFRVAGGHVVYVDVGRDIVPFDTLGFHQMAKRVYLMARWHFRPDLKELMRASLVEEDLPELTGFEDFLRAVEVQDPHELIDGQLMTLLAQQGGSTVLDFGCGDGSLSVKIKNLGRKVTAFDPDRTCRAEAGSRCPGIEVLDRNALEQSLGSGVKFDAAICSLVLCSIKDEREVEEALDLLRQALTESGHLTIVLCDPFSFDTNDSTVATKLDVRASDYRDLGSVTKRIKRTNREREDWHRPYGWYLRALRRAGFELLESCETDGVDLSTLAPAADFRIMTARPVSRAHETAPVTLLIRTCAMEWQTIKFQLHHIVGQLEGPRRFVEKVVIYDDNPGPFVRQYDPGDLEQLERALDELFEEGVIDRAVRVGRDPDSVREVLRRWFSLSVGIPTSSNGEHTASSLAGFDVVRTNYVLQLDSDCLIGRPDRRYDYLGEMLGVLENDPEALTVSMSVPLDRRGPYTPADRGTKWRTEVRCSLLALERIRGRLPLPNKLDSDGKLAWSWHRSLDLQMSRSGGNSYRGGDPRSWFVHVPNERKSNVNEWYNIAKAIERGRVYDGQLGRVNLTGSLGDWLGRRNEDMVVIVRGRNVPISKVRRCVRSLRTQTAPGWGAVFIDGASTNGMAEYLGDVVGPSWGDRATVYLNYSPAPIIENNVVAIRDLCSNPDAIIVTVDADDQLIGGGVLSGVAEAYRQGADVTVGSMLRTDKVAAYPVAFRNPRSTRGGGNVWQHLRTFRKRLFDGIRLVDLMIDGRWIPEAEDWAYMLPIVEMAEHPVHFPDPVYWYEPSPDKSLRGREFREILVADIVAKPSYRGGS